MALLGRDTGAELNAKTAAAAAALALAASACSHASGESAKPAASTPAAPDKKPLPTVVHAVRGPDIRVPGFTGASRRGAHGAVAGKLQALSGMPFASRPALTPNGPEAATWTSNDDAAVGIWRRASTGWAQVGRTTYPTNPGLPHCVPNVMGAAVQGARDAVFIVDGCFSGDGSGNAAAIANGDRGWGVLQQPRDHRLVSTGLGGHHFQPQSAVHWDMEFSHSRLVTLDSAGEFGVAGSGLYPRIQLWRWRDGGLVTVADSRFRSGAGTPPDLRSRELPSTGCPEDGTYVASFGVTINTGRPRVPNAPIALEVFPRQGSYPAQPGCTEYVSPLTSISVMVGHTSSRLTSANYTHITNRRWITAPAWVLLQDNNGGELPTPLFYRTSLSNPWFIDPAFGVNVLLTNTGDAKAPDFYNSWGHDPVPAYGTVTFRQHTLTSLAVTGTSGSVGP